MKLYLSDQEVTDPEYTDSSDNLFLRLDKGDSSIEIVSAAMVCFNRDETSLFSSTTPIGGIVYKIAEGEEQYISKFDEIVKNIKVLKK